MGELLCLSQPPENLTLRAALPVFPHPTVGQQPGKPTADVGTAPSAEAPPPTVVPSAAEVWLWWPHGSQHTAATRGRPRRGGKARDPPTDGQPSSTHWKHGTVANPQASRKAARSGVLSSLHRTIVSHLGFPDACGTVSLLFGPPLTAAALSCRVCLRKHEAQALATPMEGGCLCLAVLPGARASPTTGSSTEGAPCAGHCPECTAEIPRIQRTRACSWHWMCFWEPFWPR